MNSFQAEGGSFQLGGEHAAVAIERETGGGMAELDLDELGMSSLRYEHRSTRVAQVADAETSRKSCPLDPRI